MNAEIQARIRVKEELEAYLNLTIDCIGKLENDSKLLIGQMDTIDASTTEIVEVTIPAILKESSMV